jgi:hypothetical protein
MLARAYSSVGFQAPPSCYRWIGGLLGQFSRIALLVVLPASVHALTAMSESEMSAVSGKDGLFLQFEASSADSAISADEIRWTNDAGGANETSLSMRGMELSAPGAFPVSIAIDAGGTGTASGNSGVGIEALWDELGFTVDSLQLRDDAGTLIPQSGGQIGFFSSGGLTLFNENGLFNTGSTDARFDLSFSTDAEPGDFIIRHGPAGSPEFSFGNANLSLSMENCAVNDCTFGIDANGLLFDADLVNLDLNFDLLFKNSPTNPDGWDRGNPSDPLDIGGREQLIRLGWTGGMENFTLQINGGSIAGSEGLQIDTEFDYANDFSLILGQAGEDSPRAVFKNFEALGTPTEPEFSLPLTLDTVPGGTNMGNLCFGNTSLAACSGVGEESVSLSTDRTALAAQIRDGHVWVYNTIVEVRDPTAGGDPLLIDDPDDVREFDWSLGYTFGHFDANIVLYPGYDSNNDGSADATGLTSDVIFSISSPGYWDKAQNTDPTAGANWAENTHFFIGDTDIDGDGSGNKFGIGILNADLLWRAENTAIRIAGDSDTAFAAFDADPDIPAGGVDFDGGFWLESPEGVRYQFRGMFGGGDLDDLSDLVKVSLTDIRLDTDRFVFALSPYVGNPGEPEAIGFEGLLDFNANTYVSLAEPSNPDADFRVEGITGRVMWRDGKVQLRSQADNGGAQPSLTLANNLLIGDTASGGNELIGTVSFGGESFGRVAIPGGRWYSDITLKPKP